MVARFNALSFLPSMFRQLALEMEKTEFVSDLGESSPQSEQNKLFLKVKLLTVDTLDDAFLLGATLRP